MQTQANPSRPDLCLHLRLTTPQTQAPVHPEAVQGASRRSRGFSGPGGPVCSHGALADLQAAPVHQLSHAGHAAGLAANRGQVRRIAPISARLAPPAGLWASRTALCSLSNVQGGSEGPGGAALTPWRPPAPAARRFMAFDRHMNLVLGDAEEFRRLPPKKGKSEDEVGAAERCAGLAGVWTLFEDADLPVTCCAARGAARAGPSPAPWRGGHLIDH
jgi:hypothetical protein